MRESETGFTLLEMLVAVTLLAFLSVALVAGLRFGSNIWQKSEEKNVDTNAIRAAQKVLSDTIARIYPKYVAVAAGKGYIDFDGTPGRLRFLSTASASSGHISRETLEAAGDGMQITATPELARVGAPASRTALLRNLASVEFSYFGTASGEKTPLWHRTWQNQRALPSLIRIHAAFAGSGTTPWSDMILAPRIAADVDCTFDALVKFCRDRP